jgi:ribonuclease R
MSYHIGEEFDGVISGVTAWGLYVELPNTIEGMVHVTSLKGDYFVYNETSHEMVGEVTKITYKLGQRLHVKCVDADITGRTIDFQIVGDINE